MTPPSRARAVSRAHRPPRASSRANGTKFGRPRKVDDSEHIATAKRMKADGHTGKDIAKYLGNTASGYDTIDCHTSTLGTTGSGSPVTGLLCTQARPIGADLRLRSIKWLTTA